MRCLIRISQDPITIKYGYSIIHLTAYVQRPLNQLELREAVSVPYMTDHFDEKKLVNGSLLRFCANLVEQDHLTAIIRFVHPSVKAFLEAHFHPAQYIPSSIVTGKVYQVETNFQTVGMEHCRDICFKYISMKDFGSEIALRGTLRTSVKKSAVIDRALNIGNKGMRLAVRARHLMTKDRLQRAGDSSMVLETRNKASDSLREDKPLSQNYHLLKYVQDHWPSHTQGLEPADPTWPTFVALATRDHSAYRLNPWVDPRISSPRTKQPLFKYAISKNHLPLLRTLLDQLKPKQIIKLIEMPMNEDFERAIHLAVSKEAIDWLIQAGGPKQLTFKNIRGNTVLHYSATSGNTETLDALLGYMPTDYLLHRRNNNGKTAIAIAIEGASDIYLDRAMQGIQLNVQPIIDVAKTLKFVFAALQSILKARPNFNNRLPVIEPHITKIVGSLLEAHSGVDWSDLVTLAIEDDILAFFDLFLEHPNSWRKIAGTITNRSPDCPKGESVIAQACTISKTTKSDRVQIVERLLEFLPHEIIWYTTREPNSSAGKAENLWPLSLAMSQVTVSNVAVDIVRVIADRLRRLSSQRRYVPLMINEFDFVLGTEIGYMEILDKIDPGSVQDLLISGALKLQTHSRRLPKTTLIHVAAMKEDLALIRAILGYILESKPEDLIYWLASVSNTEKSALSLAFVGDRPRHALCVMQMIDICLDFENAFWMRRFRTGNYFGEAVSRVLGDTSESLLCAFKDEKFQNTEVEGLIKAAGKLAGKILRAEYFIESGTGLRTFGSPLDAITKDGLKEIELFAQLSESETRPAQLQNLTTGDTSLHSTSHGGNLGAQSHRSSLTTSISEESVYFSANEESLVDDDNHVQAESS